MALFVPESMDPAAVYKLMAALVVPRPIAWTSTLSPEGVDNLAPFSFFMMITSTPPHIAISVGAREGQTKDTLRNIRHTSDFVVNTVNASIGPKMARTAADWPQEISEFEALGLTPLPSEAVRPKRVAESPANLECVVREIMPVGTLPYGAHLVIAEVVRIHVRDDLLTERNRVDLRALDAVGRLTGDWYCETTEQYEMPRGLPVVGSD